MWANDQRDGHPAEHKWHATTCVPCSNAAKTRKPLKLPGVPQTGKLISAASGPKFAILWAHLGDIFCCLRSFFPIVEKCLSCEDIARQSCAIVPRWRFLTTFLRPVFSASRVHGYSSTESMTRGQCHARPTVTFPAANLSHPAEGRRLSLPEWLVIYQDSIPANGHPSQY